MEIHNPIEFRSSISNRLHTLIQNPISCKNIEIGVYNASIREATQRKIVKKWDNKHFVLLYVNKFRSIWFNINNSYVSNSQLISNLKNKTVSSRKLASLTHQEMCPEKWSDLIEAKMNRDKNKWKTDTTGASQEFKCRKCGERKTNYYQVQTRSADEPMTTFVTCLNCGNHWRC